MNSYELIVDSDWRVTGRQSEYARLSFGSPPTNQVCNFPGDRYTRVRRMSVDFDANMFDLSHTMIVWQGVDPMIG
jgi:hypothetical protein